MMKQADLNSRKFISEVTKIVGSSYSSRAMAVGGGSDQALGGGTGEN
jgi:hypothetical protein